MIFLSGGDLVLPDRVVSGGTLVIDRDRIVDVLPRTVPSATGTVVDCRNRYIVPGFIDVHVHGLEGLDTLDGRDGIARIAAALPRHGVTAFCPTSIACAPAALERMLAEVRAARTARAPLAARVLPAHLESNFINPDFRGAQPLECLRMPRGRGTDGEFTGADILDVIEAARPEVGIVTVAPELEGAIELINDLAHRGHRVSLGHSGATYEQGLAGFEAGALHATHLFNRMTSIGHRAPGLAAAVLEHSDVTAEIICDGVHVHPAMVRVALAAKGPSGVIAITDGTAGAGLPPGTRTTLAGRSITVGDAAYLEDGTIAGSVLTMSDGFARLVNEMRIAVVDAVAMCSTTPARALKLDGFGQLAKDAVADVVALDRDLGVVQTYIEGRLVWSRGE